MLTGHPRAAVAAALRHLPHRSRTASPLAGQADERGSASTGQRPERQQAQLHLGRDGTRHFGSPPCGPRTMEKEPSLWGTALVAALHVQQPDLPSPPPPDSGRIDDWIREGGWSWWQRRERFSWVGPTLVAKERGDSPVVPEGMPQAVLAQHGTTIGWWFRTDPATSDLRMTMRVAWRSARVRHSRCGRQLLATQETVDCRWSNTRPQPLPIVSHETTSHYHDDDRHHGGEGERAGAVAAADASGC